MKYRIAGISDDVTTCECCGRTDLKRTIALESGTGEIRYFGTACAAHAMGRSGRKASASIEREALNTPRITGYCVKNLTTGLVVKDQSTGGVLRFNVASAAERAERLRGHGFESEVVPLYA